MKRLTIIGIMALLGITLGVSTITAASAEPVEIHFWHIFVRGHAEALESITARFHEANPDIRVVLTHQGGYDDLNMKLAAATAAGAPPTMALLIANWVPPAYYGELMPLDNVIPEEILDDILPALVADNTFWGTLLAVPFNRTTNVLFYNTDLVPEPPQTWEELLAMAEELRIDEDGDGVFDRYGKGIRPGPEQFAFLFLQAGGQWFNEDETEFLIDSPAGIAAMEFLHELRQVSFFQTGWFSGPFGEGFVAMYWGSTAGIPFVARAAAAHETNWSIAKLPSGPLGVSYSIFMGANIGIFELGTTEEERAAAVRFLLHLLSPEEHLYWVKHTGNLPFRFTTLESPEWAAFVEENPHWEGIAEQVLLSYAYPHHLEWDSIRRIMVEMTEAVLLAEMTPEEALRWGADEVEMWYLE